MIKRILRFKEVSSTQDIAKRLINQNEELAVLAQRQRCGHGRQQRAWHSPAGGLYMSILLYPRTRFNAVPMMIALSVIRALRECGIKGLSIHWPNDILLDRKKVCGILCEKYRNAVVCGIGLNVNIKRFPRKIPAATSLLLSCRREYDVETLSRKLLSMVARFYNEMQEGRLRIAEIYDYITGIGEMVELSARRESFRGIVHDIDDDWGILIRDESGVIKKFYYGDVKRLKW
jgi:BirA family biotin operon repressor/biotin-[acetyl-CoA-carboxylase] ligase